MTPAKGLRTPRAELNGLLILTRLVSTCLDGMTRLLDRVILIGDSKCMKSSVESEEEILASLSQGEKATGTRGQEEEVTRVNKAFIL